MSTTAADLCTLLAAAGLGSLGSTLLAGTLARMPDGDGPITRVVEYSSAAPVEVHEQAGPALSTPRCQIAVHAAAYDAADAYAQMAMHVFETVHDAMLNGTRYLRVAPIQTPFDLGADAVGRARVVFNVQIMRAA